jgi:hypothetical protein
VRQDRLTSLKLGTPVHYPDLTAAAAVTQRQPLVPRVAQMF